MNTVSLLGTASTVLVGGYIFRKTIFSTIEPILFNIYKFNRNYVHPTLIKFRDYDICYRFRLLTAVISGKNINERLTNQNKYQQNGTTIQSIPKHISNNGYIKRSLLENYRAQNRGGKGKTGMSTREEDFVKES